MTTYDNMPLNVLIDLYKSRGYTVGLRYDDQEFALGDSVAPSYGWLEPSDVDASLPYYSNGEPMTLDDSGYYRTAEPLPGTCAFDVSNVYHYKTLRNKHLGYEHLSYAYLIVGLDAGTGHEPGESYLRNARICAIL